MKDMNFPYLNQRSDSSKWYLRIPIPDDLHETFGKNDKWKSLRTSDRQEAERLYFSHPFIAEWKEKFESARLGRPTGSTYDKLRRERLKRFRTAQRDIHKYAAEHEAWIDPAFAHEHPELHNEKQIVGETETALARKNISQMEQDKTVGVVNVREADKQIQALQHLINGTVPVNEPEIVTVSDTENPLLSKAIERWKQKNSHISKNQLDKKMNWIHQFITAFGDRPISDYKMQDAREYVDALDCLPKRYENLAGYKTLNILDAARKAKQQGLAPTSADYANKKIQGLSSLWASFLMTEYDDAVSKNIFMNRKIVRDKKTIEDEKQKAKPFTLDELTKIFDAPIFTGMKSKARRYNEGTLVLKDHRYWIPLVLLMHGARPNEICQLCKDDIREFNGILFMRITEEQPDQKVKNVPSVRAVPVHDELLKCGFKEFIDAAPEGRLFPALKLQKSTGRYSDNFAKVFCRMLDKLGIKERPANGEKVPYSFRHGWLDAARVSYDDPAKKMDIYARRRLFGHTVEEGEGNTYGTGYDEKRIPALKRELDKIEFVGLDLSHLYV